MFSFLRRKPKAEREPDVIWRDSALRDRGLARQAARTLQERGGRVAVLCHFAADRRRLREALRQEGATFADLEDRAARAAGVWTGPLALAPVEVLVGSQILLPAEPGLEVGLLVAGRHPLLARDLAVEAAVDAFAAQGGRARLGYHVSLDDPLLRVFGADRVAPLLAQLGMGDEPFSHAMVTRSLRAAQEKVAAQATGDLPADSAGEWLAYNCPELGRDR